MTNRRFLASIAALVLALGACGDDDESATSGPAATVTLGSACTISTDGHTHEPNTDLQVLFANDGEEEVTVDLVGSNGVAHTETVPAGESVERTLSFEVTGNYSAECDPAPEGGLVGGAIHIAE